MILLALATPAVAQTRPAADVESQPVVRARSSTTTPAEAAINWQRVVLATVVVLGLIVALRYAAVWLIPSARGGGGRGVRVLGRTPIAPRQQIVLVHVGRRVIVVGDSAGTLSSLAVIAELDEVAELVGGAMATPTASAASRFKSIFGGAHRQFDESPETMTAADDPDAIAPADPAADAVKDEIAGLRERMQKIAKTMGR